MFPSRRRAVWLAFAMLAASAAGAAAQQPTATPALSASRSVMAGTSLSVSVTGAPPGARLAIARPDDPATRAIVVSALPASAQAALPVPGVPGLYELRLTQDRDGKPVVLQRRPVSASAPEATLVAPARTGLGQALPVRGIGPNGAEDRVVLARPDEPASSDGFGHFFPAENVEATLEAPDEPGTYELRYVMNAPLAEHSVLARREVVVE